MSPKISLEKIRRAAFTLSLGMIGLLTVAYLWVIFGGSTGGGQGSYQALNFNTLNHRPAGDAFLACSTTTCPNAQADRTAFELDAGLSSVHMAIAGIIDDMPEIKRQRFDFAAGQYDLTLFLRDIKLYQVVVIKLEEQDSKTLVNLYSYQPVGSSKSSEHQARAAKFMDLLYRRLR